MAQRVERDSKAGEEGDLVNRQVYRGLGATPEDANDLVRVGGFILMEHSGCEKGPLGA